MAEGRIQMLTHRTEHAVWQPRWLVHANGAQALLSVTIAVADLGGAGCGKQQGAEHLHHGGLAGAVRPEQADDRAALDIEVDTCEGFHLAKMLLDAARLDCQGHRCEPSEPALPCDP